ncbi:hypothetical protein Glove_103g124 [Diversispora epigaea]|uniref:C2H2-type domain-containing protein n=1 Tax=Diversispora epigaea TaxID=1348612 RepID=A0A397JCX6_9GLOM|nr:hypothetical protein Glove_103g124 [Diversispora epigaea]
MAFECPFCNRVLSSHSAYSQHIKRCSENYDSSSSSSSEEIQNEFDIITPEQDDNSEDNRNNEIIYISDDEPIFSSRSNETSDIIQVEIDELPQSMNSLTFEEFASIRYEEPASREPEFETDESKFKSDETETETDSESKSDKTEFESDKTDNESDESEESESAEEETETISKFPNNTYSDLMTLIIQHNLNNKARNVIIRFFNKHSNLLTSLLPKNIEQGRKLMDRMKLINLLNKEKHIKRCSENYDSSSSSSSEEIQNEFDIITPEQDDNSEDNRNNEIIYISDDEPIFSSRSNETSDIIQVEIDELPQSMNSLTFEEFASIRYEEPASREPEFETDESKFKSDETETETDSESKSDKTEFESDKTDNESDESEESESAEEETETISKFPNNTYSDLMTLIIQHNLNNKARNVIIRFFNKHSNLLTSLLPKNIEQGRKLMDRMKLINLLNKEKTNNNRNYNEQYTSNWWAQTEKTLPTGSYLLSIILYSDASTTDSLGKNTLHPIFVTLGNIITWRRNKPDVKQLLAYLPIIKAKDDTQKISEEHKNIVCRTFHKSLKFLLSPLYDDNSIELELNNSIFWCFPRISMIISDWPEACTFALTYKSTKSNYPCHFCLVFKKDLSNINLNSNQIEPRSHNNMKLYYKNNTEKNISIENVRNFFWSVPNINIYAATVPDRMHHLDLGLFQHQLNFTKILINKQCGKSVIDEMNRRVKLIPRYKDLKSNINIYAATVPDRMHHLDLGLFQHQLNFTKILINKQCGKSVIDEMNRRVKLIPRYKDLKSFLYLHAKLFCGPEIAILGKKVEIVFIEDEIILLKTRNFLTTQIYSLIKDTYNWTNSTKIPEVRILLKITEVYLKWNKMYLLSRKENYEESDVTLLQANLFIELFKEHSKSELQFPKLHSWVFHIYSSIREFGVINGYTTETYESLHKDYVKKPYKLTNKKEIEKQIMKIIRRKAIITESSSKEIPKTPIALKYSKKLYKFCIQNAEIYIQTRMNDPDFEKEMKLGFEKFLECLDAYLDFYDRKLSEHEEIDMIFHIYGVILQLK